MAEDCAADPPAKFAASRAEDIDAELACKRLSVANWLDADPASHVFVKFTQAGFVPVRAGEWAALMLAVELAPTVPLEVRRLFAVARGVLVYGGLFYPLYALGQDRLFVVADTAALHRYRAAGGPRDARGGWPIFAWRLRWLRDNAILTSDDFDRWNALRHLRNSAAHPDFQTMSPPGQALGVLQGVASDINALFASHTK